MKKVITVLGFLLLSAVFVFAQSDEELFGSDDDLFGTEEDFFGSEDDLFLDDGIEEITDTTAKDNLSKGILFEAGSVKVGGSLRAGIDTNTKLYTPDESDLGENIKNTKLAPTLSAYLSVDARPTETLRIYTKFGMAYPFVVKGDTVLLGSNNIPVNWPQIIGGNKPATIAETSISDWFSLKELFTDFSIKDRAFFRFGLHTVSWGTGYFFSPVSDMINTSSIDPENPTEQVNGALNLRTQVVFPGSQNCLWLYLIPSNNFSAGSAESYARDTAVAAKYDFVVGDWELGAGTYWKYENAPKLMATVSGSIKKVSLFGEFVYQYGAASEWVENKNWDDKTNIIQATAGGFYTWKDPGIMVGLQYYYDGNDVDFSNRIFSDGHNIALMANFTKFGSVKKLSASLFGIVNFGKTGFTDMEKALLTIGGNSVPELPTLTINASLIYRPIDDISLSIGPGIVFTDFEKEPTVSLKIGATLGGGKF